MISAVDFYRAITLQSDFITGVPDSLLKALNSVILERHPPESHVIAPNEGTAVALAIGNYISSRRPPTVYMQNSGIGNAINPLVSLADGDVYGVPMVIILGWRGEPGLKDEPQHYKQGLIQIKLLETLGIEFEVIDKNSDDFQEIVHRIYMSAIADHSPKVILVRKNTFGNYDTQNARSRTDLVSRERALESILDEFDNASIFVGTTGKLSRELFELRKSRGEDHSCDFLTVGGMGHASSIAVGISMNTRKRVVCLDGDGALLMHMGSLVSTAAFSARSFVHIVLNNGVHESVGGQPTLIDRVTIPDLAASCGYKQSVKITSPEELRQQLACLDLDNGPTLVEFKIGQGSRSNLGRPTHSPKSNLHNLINAISS